MCRKCFVLVLLGYVIGDAVVQETSVWCELHRETSQRWAMTQHHNINVFLNTWDSNSCFKSLQTTSVCDSNEGFHESGDRRMGSVHVVAQVTLLFRKDSGAAHDHTDSTPALAVVLDSMRLSSETGGEKMLGVWRERRSKPPLCSTWQKHLFIICTSNLQNVSATYKSKHECMYRASEPDWALTHVWDSKTETLGTSLRITGLQVKEALLTQVTVWAHHISLRTHRERDEKKVKHLLCFNTWEWWWWWMCVFGLVVPCTHTLCRGRCWDFRPDYTHSECRMENLCIQTHSAHIYHQQNPLYTNTDLQTVLHNTSDVVKTPHLFLSETELLF